MKECMRDRKFCALQNRINGEKWTALLAAVIGLVLTCGQYRTFLQGKGAWVFWAFAGVTVVLLCLACLTYRHSPGRNSLKQSLIIRNLFTGDNLTPFIGLISFLTLLYGINLMSTLVSGGAPWQRTVTGACFIVNVIIMAESDILHEANRNSSSRNLKDASELVYSISRPNFATAAFRQASIDDILHNNFSSEDTKSPANINPLFMSIQYHLPALRQVDILISKEVENYSQDSHDGGIENLLAILEEKIHDMTGEEKTTGTIQVRRCNCETGNEIRSFFYSVEEQLKLSHSIPQKTPSDISVSLTSGTTSMTTALLLFVMKYNLMAEYVPQRRGDGKMVNPEQIPTEMASEIVEPLNRRFSGNLR